MELKVEYLPLRCNRNIKYLSKCSYIPPLCVYNSTFDLICSWMFSHCYLCWITVTVIDPETSRTPAHHYWSSYYHTVYFKHCRSSHLKTHTHILIICAYDPFSVLFWFLGTKLKRRSPLLCEILLINKPMWFWIFIWSTDIINLTIANWNHLILIPPQRLCSCLFYRFDFKQSVLIVTSSRHKPHHTQSVCYITLFSVTFHTVTHYICSSINQYTFKSLLRLLKDHFNKL